MDRADPAGSNSPMSPALRSGRATTIRAAFSIQPKVLAQIAVRHSCRDRAATPVWAMPMPVRCGAIRFSASLRQDSCRQDSCRQDSSQQTACRQAMPMAPTGCASRMNRPIAARLSMPGRAAAIPVAQLRARPRSVRFHKESRCPRRITAEASEFADLPCGAAAKKKPVSPCCRGRPVPDPKSQRQQP